MENKGTMSLQIVPSDISGLDFFLSAMFGLGVGITISITITMLRSNPSAENQGG